MTSVFPQGGERVEASVWDLFSSGWQKGCEGSVKQFSPLKYSTNSGVFVSSDSANRMLIAVTALPPGSLYDFWVSRTGWGLTEKSLRLWLDGVSAAFWAGRFPNVLSVRQQEYTHRKGGKLQLQQGFEAMGDWVINFRHSFSVSQCCMTLPVSQLKSLILQSITLQMNHYHHYTIVLIWTLFVHSMLDFHCSLIISAVKMWLYCLQANIIPLHSSCNLR